MTIYRVDVKVKDTEETRLIEAPNMAQAMRFVGQKMMSVAAVTTAEAHELGAKGIKLEQAGNGKEPS